MMHLNEDNKEIDVVTLMDQLTTEGSLSEAGGPQYLAELSTNVLQQETFNIILISYLNMHLNVN